MDLKKKKGILHYPQLDTVLMVEEFIREHSGEYRRKELWEKLPKGMMYQTYQVILAYLLESNKISADSEGKIGWIWNPQPAKKYMKKKHISWRNPKNDNVIDMHDIKQIKKAAVPILKKNGVVKAGIFGSYATGKAKEKSDIDLLIKFKGKKSLLDLAGLKLELESKLGKKVDVLTYKSVHPLLKERILKDEERIL